jgi:hypothetical protein
MCGTDELKRQAVIDEYAEMEIDLGVSYEWTYKMTNQEWYL